jgi:alpha-L-arabinofuranosidase
MHYTMTLTTAAGIRPSQDNRFVISAAHTGTVWLNLVSLFPSTWHNRPNGLRPDLMGLLSAMHPTFLRFPGGNYLEGQTVDTRFEWKNTIGPLALRPGHPDDAWGYRSTDGLGLMEYLEWCEDLHLTPVLAVYAGYSLDREVVPAGPKLRPFVQDALDEIQYATGSVHTRWGALRAADGHPAPFVVPYVEVGNEDFFDNSGSYDDRFTQFYDAIRATYPAIKIIATTDTFTRHADVVDEHYYMTPQWFAENADHYDGYNRNGPKIFVGEYAAQVGDIAHGQPTLGAALGEAAWMTGLERNSDVVIMAAFAPLFQNENLFQWTPDLISYDSLNSYGSPSYYVQKLFGINRGDVVVPSTLSGSGALYAVASKVNRTGTVYLIVVNVGPAAQSTHIAIKGATVSPTGMATVLTAASPDAMNSLSAPDAVAPVTHRAEGLGRSFNYVFRPYSVTVLRLSTGPEQ